MAGEWLASASKYHVTIIREEGSNGVMAAAMYAAGFEPWDVSDLLSGRVTLEGFRGIVFVGGFSYADVLESARGWAATILNSKELKAHFDTFYARPDTVSLDICNGYNGYQMNFVEGHRGGQAAALHPEKSRLMKVRVKKSNAIMLQGMENSLDVWVSHKSDTAQVTIRNLTLSLA